MDVLPSVEHPGFLLNAHGDREKYLSKIYDNVFRLLIA